MNTKVLPTTHDPSIISFGTCLNIARRGNKLNILLIALTRPSVKNAFHSILYQDLIHLLYLTTDDSSIDAIVLTGTGLYFSSGADINSSFQEHETKSQETNHSSMQFMMEILKYPKILCAAVNGPALGIAVTLLFHCDLCYCVHDATFWIPFTRLALVPEFASSFTLVESMGLSKANELLLLGKKIDSKTAKDMNLCSTILSMSDLSECIDRLDPFTRHNIGDYMIQELDSYLFHLPYASGTSKLFTEMIRGRRRRLLEQVCQQEMNILQDRITKGEVKNALTVLMMNRTRTSKL